MNNQNKNDNAANRKSYIGYIYNKGEKEQKHSILDAIDKKWKDLHEQGYIHIHDLDAYGLTYNCLTFDILKGFPYKRFKNLNEEEIIVEVFEFIKELFSDIGNEQSGGMSFANFDIDFAIIFKNLNVDILKYKKILKASIKSLVRWCNNTHTRMGQTSYYTTFCLGLGINEDERLLSQCLIDSFSELGDLVYKPNIVFKVHQGINRFKNDPNYDLLASSLRCSAKKMIPTYLLCDCESDKNTDPYKLSIMGCRTRVVNNIHGEDGAIGRSNIDNISINLPRIALEVINENKNLTEEQKVTKFKDKWLNIANATKDILLDRFEKTCKSDIDLFPTNKKYQVMRKDINDGLEEQFKQGTLSIGFIGLSEAIEIMFGDKYWKNDDLYKIALELVKFMRTYTDECTQKYNLNFSLLASAGELISGRFLSIDRKLFNSHVMEKNYYTNSFHVDVDSDLPAYKKIELEGPFHTLSNGGCITYIELKEAPLGNVEGLDELIEIAIKSGVHYLGFNFPKDVCNKCDASGIFDECPECGNKQITRIRRVSGYLEIQDFFTEGKFNESKTRKGN